MSALSLNGRDTAPATVQSDATRSAWRHETITDKDGRISIRSTPCNPADVPYSRLPWATVDALIRFHERVFEDMLTVQNELVPHGDPDLARQVNEALNVWEDVGWRLDRAFDRARQPPPGLFALLRDRAHAWVDGETH